MEAEMRKNRKSATAVVHATLFRHHSGLRQAILTLRKRWLRLLSLAGLVLIFSLMSNVAHAFTRCWFINGADMLTTSLTLPSLGPLPHDLNEGDILWDSEWVAKGSTTISCYAGEDVTIGYNSAMTPTSQPLVYETGVPGIGIKVAYSNTLNNNLWASNIDSLATTGDTGAWRLQWPRVTSAMTKDVNYTPASVYRVQLIVTGPLQGGTFTTTLPKPIAATIYGGLTTNVVTFTDATITVQIAQPTPTRFNAFESLSNYPYLKNAITTTDISGPILTKLANTPYANNAFALVLVAIKDGALLTGFNDKVKVELVANAGTPGTGYDADSNCPLAYELVPTIYQQHTYDSPVADANTSSFTLVDGRLDTGYTTTSGNNRPTRRYLGSDRAYRDVRVRISWPADSPTVVSCSSDNFAIRPFYFQVTSSDTAIAGFAKEVMAGTQVLRAGTDAFNLTVTTTPGYDGTPVMSTTDINYFNASSPTGGTLSSGSNYKPGSSGTLTGSFGRADPATGAASGNFIWSEVGMFYLLGAYGLTWPNGSPVTVTTGNLGPIIDNEFTKVDQATGDCLMNNIRAIYNGDRVGCGIGIIRLSPWDATNQPAGYYVGRFVPDHFEVTTTPACKNTFTYAGQPFTVKVTARNGKGGVTQNYNPDAGYARQVNLSDVTASADAGVWRDSVIPPSAFSTIDKVTGKATNLGIATATPAFSFTPRPGGPATLHVRAAENGPNGTPAGDSVSSENYDLTALINIRDGRLRLFNAFGSARQDLVMSIQAQYWTGQSWVINSDDNCTTLTADNIYLSNTIDGLAVGKVSNVSGGKATLTLNPPDGGLTVTTDIAINLGATGSGVDTSCLATHGGEPGKTPWLRARNGSCDAANNWTSDPAARATFGIYSAENERLIHRREVFR
jgi:hypothetical protein